MRTLCAVLLGVAVAVTPAWGQTVPDYDPEAEVTITGVVVDVHESKAKSDHPGLHFVLGIPPASTEANQEAAPAAPPPAAPDEAEMEPAPDAAAGPPPAPTETVEVHACPVQFLTLLDFPVEKGDEITVTGSRPGGGPILIAREITKGAVKLQVRDEAGEPIWDELR
jgi:hypothetical protein